MNADQSIKAFKEGWLQAEGLACLMALSRNAECIKEAARATVAGAECSRDVAALR